MALEKVGDYTRQAGVLLNDVDAVRYTLQHRYDALALALSDAYRLRPDLFMMAAVPDELFPATDLTMVDRTIRAAVLDYIVGYCERMDQETSDTARATMYYASFSAKLIGSAA